MRLLWNCWMCFHHILGWSVGAKVSGILCHRGVQLILAYSWARPVILVAGKGRKVMFLFLLFLHFHSCSSFFPVTLFHLFCYLFCRLFSLSLGDDTQWPTRVDVSVNPNTINFTIFHFGPSIEKKLRIYSNGLAPLTNIVVLPIYGTEYWNISQDTQEMPQSRSTTYPKHQKKERWGTTNDKTNATYKTTDAQIKQKRLTTLEWSVG